MAYTTINKSTDHFNTVTYTGNGSARTITTGMQPDLNWIKRRNQVDNHWWTDSVRGATKYIGSNRSNAEATESTAVTGITSTGFTLGDDSNQGEVNANTYTYCSWNWKANGAGSANTDGSINSTVSVNTTAGFSIVSWTGSGANATIGHGLGASPKMIIFKNRDATTSWMVYHASEGATKFFRLNNGNAVGTGSTPFNDTEPTSSVFSVGANGDTNGSSQSMIAYCFAEKQGYSKFGSYTGNGNADGTFVYTGFKPSWLLIKRTTQESWIMTDSKRGYPQSWNYLLADATQTESGGLPYDFVSNGIKFRGTTQNESGSTYIFMAFGQSIVGSNNIPATAR